MTWEVSDVPWQVERECWCQGGWRRCWVQMWITKGPPHRSNPGITETPTVTSCKMGRCQDMLCFAKEWNWKLLLLGYFSFSQGKKVIVLFWMNAWGARVEHPSLTVQKSVISLLPHPLLGVPGERFCTIPKKRIENNFPQCRWGAWTPDTLLDDEGRRDRRGCAPALPPLSAVSHLVCS